jgi:hypothetical protein
VSLFDGPDLLARCKLHARRPVVDVAMPDASWYSLLTEAQPEVYDDLFSRFPSMQYSAPIQLTTGDGGYTYGFGTTAEGARVRPMGQVEVYANLRAIPDDPLVPGDDFIIEGGLIRIPGHRSRIFSEGPYARLVVVPDVAITAASDEGPALQPPRARMLLVWKALEAWAARPGSGMTPDHYRTRYADTLNGILLEMATAFNRQTGEASNTGSRWYTQLDLGGGSRLNT